MFVFGRRILFGHNSMNRKKPSKRETCSEVVRGVYISHLDDPSKNFRVAELCKGSKNTRNLQYLSV